MIGVIVNALAVIIGSIIGLLAKKGIPKQWADMCMYGLALCAIAIGIQGVLKGQNMLISIIAMVVGTVIGMALKLDVRLDTFANAIENKFGGKGEGSIAEGFITASILFCIGAMTIVGALQAGLLGDNQMLFSKSGLDFVSSILFAAALGVGVLYSAAFVLVFEGAIVLLAQYLAPYLGTNVINEITAVGSLIIICIGFNILKITDIKVINFSPAIILPVALVPLFNLISSLL